jgi:hypothetical protein
LEGLNCDVCLEDVRRLFELVCQGRILTEDGYARLRGTGVPIPEYQLKDLIARAKVHHGKEARERREIEGRPISQEDINDWLIDSRRLKV